MSVLSYLPHQPQQVLDALRQGNISTMEVATEQVPDFFLLYAIESGLLEALAKSFPDPRVQQPEIRACYELWNVSVGICWQRLCACSVRRQPSRCGSVTAWPSDTLLTQYTG